MQNSHCTISSVANRSGLCDVKRRCPGCGRYKVCGRVLNFPKRLSGDIMTLHLRYIFVANDWPLGREHISRAAFQASSTSCAFVGLIYKIVATWVGIHSQCLGTKVMPKYASSLLSDMTSLVDTRMKESYQ